MSGERITRVTLAEARKMKGLTDWDRVRALTDEDIDRAIAEDPDAAPEWTEEEWRRARVMVPAMRGWRYMFRIWKAFSSFTRSSSAGEKPAIDRRRV